VIGNWSGVATENAGVENAGTITYGKPSEKNIADYYMGYSLLASESRLRP